MVKNVSSTQMENLPYIIAVDFDGTLVEDEFPAIGMIRTAVWEDLERARNAGAKVILWTSRDGEYLRDAIEFCTHKGLHFDAINENIDEVRILFNNDTRKIHADEYWDDKAIQKYCNQRSILDPVPEEEDMW